MSTNKQTIYLYALKQGEQTMYLGLTKNPQSRKQNHKNKRPNHTFVILEKFTDVFEASQAERDLIYKYNTIEEGWNKSPGGEYEKNSGYNRKGIGGVPKGTIPWNKGKPNCFPRSLIERFRKERKGVIFRSKLSLDQIAQIRERFRAHELIEGVGLISKNGKPFTQERLFSRRYHKEYGITEANLYKIVKGKSWDTKSIKRIHSTKS
jgi:hypothetical protein